MIISAQARLKVIGQATTCAAAMMSADLHNAGAD
jgi:hypothetical protein